MHASGEDGQIRVGPWIADRGSGTLQDGGRLRRLEPKAMDLLFLLAEHAGSVLSKETIMARIWPDTTVGDDTLARCVSKLRKALDDNPKQARFIETIPKRGYRLRLAGEEVSARIPSGQAAAINLRRWPVAAVIIIAVVAVAGWLVWSVSGTDTNPYPVAPEVEELTRQANDFYFQYTRADNESAIQLYERIIASSPDYAPGQSGLASALVQRVLRWPTDAGDGEIHHQNLEQAIVQGRTGGPRAEQILERAQALAERAVRLDPEDAAARRSLGLVYATQEKFELAIREYEAAVALNPDAWGAMINLGDIMQMQDRDREALRYFEQAYAAMTRVYDQQGVRVRPWYAEVAVAIGNKYRQMGQPQEAEIWFRQVLDYAPYHVDATVALARIFRANGEPQAADELCRKLIAKIGEVADCNVMSNGYDEETLSGGEH